MPMGPSRTAEGARPVGVCVFDPELENRPDLDSLRVVHGLTPAESRLAGLFVAGHSLEEAAKRLSISIHTARTHLKRILSKTRTRRQSALVRLLLLGPAALSPLEMAANPADAGAGDREKRVEKAATQS